MYIIGDKDMRRTKEEAELTCQSILDAATKEFSRNGYAATQLEDIAETAAVTRGAVYHHSSGGKADRYADIIEQAKQTGNKAINTAIQESGLFLNILQRILLYTLKLLPKDAQFRAAMSLLIFNSGDSPDLFLLRAARLEQGLMQKDQITGFFQMAIEQQAVRNDLDPNIAARAFWAYQNGLILMWLSAPGSISVEQHANGLAEIFVRGIAG
jgi:TetR/AcrR family acrAB operon transcriptional repressor